MNWKIIVSLAALILLSLAFQMFTSETIEELTNNEKAQLKRILKNPRISSKNKIAAIKAMKIKSPIIDKILNRRNRAGVATSDTQQIVDMMKEVK